jgi:hypothetical protein
LHEPVAQDAPDAFAGAQGTPHEPQLESDVSDVSQPSESPPPQLPHPPLHVVMTHVPVAQLSPALASSHVRPHEPQLVSEVSDVSQPSAQPPVQLPHPE